MIVDCFPFFNELDLLRKRLDMLRGIVNAHILTESPRTYSGKEKHLYFEDNKNDFLQYPIVHLICEAPISPDPWENERTQRDYCLPILATMPRSTMVLVGDIDEFPDPDLLMVLDHAADPITLGMVHYQGTQDCVIDGQWPGTSVVSVAYLMDTAKSLDKIRWCRSNFRPVLNGGWHYSWFGGVDRVIEKVEAYSHQENNTNEFKNRSRILAALEKGEPLNG